MQKSVSYNSKKNILLTTIGTFFYLSLNIEPVLSGGGDTIQTATTGDLSVNTSAPLQNTSSVTTTPTTLLQTGTNNYANVNSSTGALNYPNCGGTCGFAIMRTAPANNINGTMSNQIEGVIGLIHTFSSPDQTNAETNRQLVDIQKQRSESEIATNYIKAIADACQVKDSIRAELNAKGLGRIWNVDYKTLINSNCM